MLLSSLESGTEASESAADEGFNGPGLSVIVADDNRFAQLLNAEIYNIQLFSCT